MNKEETLTKHTQEITKTKKELVNLKGKIHEIVQTNKEYNAEVRKMFVTTIVGALSIVAGLFWQDAIKGIVAYYIPGGDSLLGKVITAGIITLAFAILIVILNKWLKKKEEAGK